MCSFHKVRGLVERELRWHHGLAFCPVKASFSLPHLSILDVSCMVSSVLLLVIFPAEVKLEGKKAGFSHSQQRRRSYDTFYYWNHFWNLFCCIRFSCNTPQLFCFVSQHIWSGRWKLPYIAVLRWGVTETNQLARHDIKPPQKAKVLKAVPLKTQNLNKITYRELW